MRSSSCDRRFLRPSSKLSASGRKMFELLSYPIRLVGPIIYDKLATLFANDPWRL